MIFLPTTECQVCPKPYFYSKCPNQCGDDEPYIGPVVKDYDSGAFIIIYWKGGHYVYQRGSAAPICTPESSHPIVSTSDSCPEPPWNHCFYSCCYPTLGNVIISDEDFVTLFPDHPNDPNDPLVSVLCIKVDGCCFCSHTYSLNPPTHSLSGVTAEGGTCQGCDDSECNKCVEEDFCPEGGLKKYYTITIANSCSALDGTWRLEYHRYNKWVYSDSATKRINILLSWREGEFVLELIAWIESAFSGNRCIRTITISTSSAPCDPTGAGDAISPGFECTQDQWYDCHSIVCPCEEAAGMTWVLS